MCLVAEQRGKNCFFFQEKCYTQETFSTMMYFVFTPGATLMMRVFVGGMTLEVALQLPAATELIG